MFRELVEEFVVLVGFSLCVPFIVMISFFHSSGLFLIDLSSALDFIGLLCFTLIHMQGLLKSGKKKRLIIFLILTFVVILASGSLFWESYQPMPA